jgi:ABC-2 type transport system permease protein
MTRIVARIAWHECRVLWRDQRLRWAAGILAVLLAIAGAVSIQLVGRRSAAIVEAQHEQREQWLQKRVSNAHVAAHAGITVFRPVHPLAIFDSGIDDVVGQSVFLEPHRRSLLTNSRVERSSSPPQFAELTIAFTLQTLVPLLIVLVTSLPLPPNGSRARCDCWQASASVRGPSSSGRHSEWPHRC